MTEVAHASGFASLRRFNEDVRSVFHATPTELRRRRSGRSGEDEPSTIVLRLPYRAPFAYPELLAFLAARAIPRVERVQDGAYTRTIEVGGRVGRIDVRQDADGRHLRLAVRGVVGPELLATVTRVRRLFDLDASPSLIDAHLSRDPRLGGVGARGRGCACRERGTASRSRSGRCSGSRSPSPGRGRLRAPVERFERRSGPRRWPDARLPWPVEAGGRRRGGDRPSARAGRRAAGPRAGDGG